MEVKIRIETECPVPNQTTDLKINLGNVECIGDLKKKLQPLLSVAACDMSVYHKTQVSLSQKLENRERISTMYVQEGDTFIVKFVSVCEMHFLNDFLDNMRAFVNDVCEAFSEGENVDWTVRAISNCYRTVLRGLANCTKDIFLPWNNRQTNANKHYFVQEGGLELLATIYNYASRRRYPLTGENDEWAPRHFNDKQTELEISCLFCLWSFSEREEDCRMVLRKIGLEPFIHSLIKVTPDYDVIRINEVSVGCFASFVELPEAENQEVLSKFLWLTFDGSDNDCRQAAANALFCCSNHPKAVTKIIENQWYRSMLERAKGLELAREDRSALPFTYGVAYFLCLILANIQTLAEVNLLTYDEIQNIDQILEAFLRIFTPSEIGHYEKSHQCVWITLIPFLQLALSGPSRPVEAENESRSQDPVDARSEMESQYQENSRNEKSCDGELCNIHGSQGSVGPKSEIENQSQEISRNEQTCDVESCKSHGSPYKFSPAEKLGLFCLCHLVETEENRELFRKEKIVDYLICVRWFAQQFLEVVELTPKLDGFGHFEPPRLASIAKAYLSKCFGYKVKWGEEAWIPIASVV